MKKLFTKSFAFLTMLALVLTLSTPITTHAASRKTPKLNKTKVTLTISKKKPKPAYQLKVKNTSKKVTWKSSNKKIATVSKKGKVVAKKKGNAVITAKVGKKTLRCQVYVKDTRKSKATVTKKQATCKHSYKNHWATFEEYYKLNFDELDGSCSCNCGIFINENDYVQHKMECAWESNDLMKKSWEKCMGLHGTSAEKYYYISNTSNNVGDDVYYILIRTKYIDKRTCTKCGIVRTTFDMPSNRSDKIAPAIDKSKVPVKLEPAH